MRPGETSIVSYTFILYNIILSKHTRIILCLADGDVYYRSTVIRSKRDDVFIILCSRRRITDVRVCWVRGRRRTIIDHGDDVWNEGNGWSKLSDRVARDHRKKSIVCPKMYCVSTIIIISSYNLLGELDPMSRKSHMFYTYYNIILLIWWLGQRTFSSLKPL